METSMGSEASVGSYSLFRSIGSEPRHLWSQKKTNQSISDKSDTDLDQLFVFGYSCKLFRDDRRAQEIDSGQHLIGWNGSSDHLIDRFDVRGYLHDLTQFQDINQNSTQEVTPQESEVERLCDEERYADLKYDDFEDNHEEELKRLHIALADGSTYSQISYNYDETNADSSQTTNEANIAEQMPKVDDSTDGFKLPSGLSPPEGIQLPKSQKLHNIIEKTASFVNKQGKQMEIVLKTKQSSNRNFDFLSFDSELHPYYKYILENIKSGKYIPKEIQNSDGSDSEDSDDDHYLHPSLLGSAKSRTEQSFKIPHLLRAPNNDDSYSQLVKSFKDRFPVNEEPTETEKPVSQQTPKQFVSIDTETIKNLNNREKNANQTSWSSLLPSPPPDIEQIIEKLAQRVALNGEQFELSIRKLGENRFEFVNPGHIYHAHYIRRKIHHLEENRKAQVANHKKQTKTDSQTSKAPVSFSITTKESKPSAPIGTTDDNNLLTIGSSKREEERNCNSELNAKRISDNALKDKLALAVRDKAAKDKQEERKRKAALFLSLLKNKSKQTKSDSNENISENVSTFGPEFPKPKTSANNAPLSPTIVAVTSPNASPEADKSLNIENSLSETVLNLKNYESAKSGSLLPFIVSDKPLKDSKRLSPHRHHKSRHSSCHKKSHKTKRSRSSKSRSRSSSRSPSRSRRKHSKHSSKSRSRSRSRSHSRSHKRQ